MDKVSAVILAGGRSSRMGQNKALLQFNKQSVIASQIQELRKGFSPIIVVSNEPDLYMDLGVEVVRDRFPGSGPLAGIQAGLEASPTDAAFVVPCDMPFVTAELGRQMFSHLGDFDGLVLQISDHLEPLCALYTKRCLPVIEQFLQAGRRKVIDFYPSMKIKILSTKKLSLNAATISRLLFNVNTPQDFALAQEILKQAPRS